MKEIEIIENEILSILKDKYKLKIEKACFASGSIPKLILLDRTRNIHSYIIICVKKNNNIISSQFGNIKDLETNLISLTKIQYSALDRPLFMVYQDEIQAGLKTIEVSEIKELFLLDKFSKKNLFQLAIDFDKVVPLIKQEL